MCGRAGIYDPAGRAWQDMAPQSGRSFFLSANCVARCVSCQQSFAKALLGCAFYCVLEAVSHLVETWRGGAPMGPPTPRAVAMGGALALRSGCATGLGGASGSATDQTFSSFFFLLCRDPTRKREGERMAQLRTASWARVPWMTSSTCPPNSASRPVPGPPGHPVLPLRPGPGAHQDLVAPRPAPACAHRLPPGHPLAQTLELMRELSAGEEPVGSGLGPKLLGDMCLLLWGAPGVRGWQGRDHRTSPASVAVPRLTASGVLPVLPVVPAGRGAHPSPAGCLVGSSLRVAIACCPSAGSFSFASPFLARVPAVVRPLALLLLCPASTRPLGIMVGGI